MNVFKIWSEAAVNLAFTSFVRTHPHHAQEHSQRRKCRTGLRSATRMEAPSRERETRSESQKASLVSIGCHSPEAYCME